MCLLCHNFLKPDVQLFFTFHFIQLQMLELDDKNSRNRNVLFSPDKFRKVQLIGEKKLYSYIVRKWGSLHF